MYVMLGFSVLAGIFMKILRIIFDPIRKTNLWREILLLMIKIVIFIFGAKIVTIMSFCKFRFVARKLLSFFTKDPVGKGPLKKAGARALLLALPVATPAGVGAQAQAVLSGLKPRQPRHRWRPWLLCCAVLRERA